MTVVEQQLFGRQSFLQFTLAASPVLGKPSAMLGNHVTVELWGNGVLSFRPQQSDLTNSILLSVGVHGNETAPIEIIDQLVNDIFAERITVKHNLLIVIANPAAINSSCREIDENMNRLFDADFTTDNTTSDERQRSCRLMEYSRTFFAFKANQKIHYDLHTAIRDSYYKKFAVSPNASELPITQQQFSRLSQWGIEAILTTTKKNSTYSNFTANYCGATSFTVELGKVKPFGENDIADFCSVITGLHAAVSDDKYLTVATSVAKRFSVTSEILKQTESFRLCFADDVANFTEFEIGTVLATDKNYQYIVKDSGERIVFPNKNVAIGQRALVIIKPEDNKNASIL
jgi:succinylglutamate desuccinylase